MLMTWTNKQHAMRWEPQGARERLVCLTVRISVESNIGSLSLRQ